MDYKIGTRLKEIRESKGLTAKYVASVLGVSPSTISKYESNDRSVKAEMLPKLAEALDTNIEDFFKQKVGKTSTKSTA